MFWFILGLITVCIAVVLFTSKPIPVTQETGSSYTRTTSTVGHEHLPIFIPILVLAAGLLMIVGSCITTIGTRDVGVVTSFGRPTGRDLENGAHVKAPWQAVAELDGAIQPDKYKSIPGGR